MKQAKRHHLGQLRGVKSAYAAAPQVFYFTPQRRWYLIFQTNDGMYQPVYSTTDNLSDPASWTPAQPLVEKNDSAKWIDFWVLCDEQNAYLYFTRDHRDVVVMQTAKKDFSRGFADMRSVYSPLIEATHVYRVKGLDRYVMLLEAADGPLRKFELVASSTPIGPWTMPVSPFASGSQLLHKASGPAWNGRGISRRDSSVRLRRTHGD